MLSSSAGRAGRGPSSAAARSSAVGRRLGSSRTGFSPHSSQRCGSTARTLGAAGRPRPAVVVGEPRQRVQRLGHARGQRLRGPLDVLAASDTGAHDGITGRNRLRAREPCRPARATPVRRYGRRPDPARPAARCPPRGACRGSRRLTPSRSRRAISRSPSMRAGWSAGRPGIRRAMRSRICRAKCGVEAPISWRTSSTDLVAGRLADGALGFAHGLLVGAGLDRAFLISRRQSMCACAGTEIALSSPTIQP